MDEYSLLSPFLQDYIYKHGWEELHDIQKKAIRVILKSDYHMLIASGTASGKTEAAFFPILTLLEKDQPKSVGVLYIGPLKALINDQFSRLETLLEDSEIPLWHWHGDVSQSEKDRVKRKPSGILQITPESLESLVMRSPEVVKRIFSDLRFVIIDEIHTFMGTERGLQLLCLLKRVENLANCSPRRIGLSATINDYIAAMLWLKADTERHVVKNVDQTTKKHEVSVEYFCLPPINRATLILPKPYLKLYAYAYRETYLKNALIFTNSRADAEIAIVTMKRIARARKENEDQFHVHHSSLSNDLRKEAESALKNPYKSAVTAATSSLELGLDIGDLDKVLQIGAPHSASSYVQRLGRSGRRGKSSRMQFICPEVFDKPSIPGKLPWVLLQIIAVIELYDKEHWVEPFTNQRKPFSLLFHQTISVLYSSGGMSPRDLARTVLRLPAFNEITKEEYRFLLQSLLHEKYLELTSDHLLRIGQNIERMVNHYDFTGVFENNEEYTVICENKKLGTLDKNPLLNQIISLGGRTWCVTKVDMYRHEVEVIAVDATGDIPHWSGLSIGVHTKIIKKMREILLSDEEYPYLSEAARTRLAEGREHAKKYNLCNCLVYEVEDIIPTDESESWDDYDFVIGIDGDAIDIESILNNSDLLSSPENLIQEELPDEAEDEVEDEDIYQKESTFYIVPWIGTREIDTLYREIKYVLADKLHILSVDSENLYTLRVSAYCSRDELIDGLNQLRNDVCDVYDLIDENERINNHKYDWFIPHELQTVELAEDILTQDFQYN